MKSKSSQETQKIAFGLAGILEENVNFKKARVVLLKGNLGAGKTTFVIGFLKYFGIKPSGASPTFVIMKRYGASLKFKVKNSKLEKEAKRKVSVKEKQKLKKELRVENIYHLDAYRLKSKEDLKDLDFDRIMSDPKNIVLIEWPEMIKGKKMKDAMVVEIDYGEKENEREIKIIKT